MGGETRAAAPAQREVMQHDKGENCIGASELSSATGGTRGRGAYQDNGATHAKGEAPRSEAFAAKCAWVGKRDLGLRRGRERPHKSPSFGFAPAAGGVNFFGEWSEGAEQPELAHVRQQPAAGCMRRGIAKAMQEHG